MPPRGSDFWESCIRGIRFHYRRGAFAFDLGEVLAVVLVETGLLFGATFAAGFGFAFAAPALFIIGSERLDCTLAENFFAGVGFGVAFFDGAGAAGGRRAGAGLGVHGDRWLR